MAKKKMAKKPAKTVSKAAKKAAKKPADKKPAMNTKASSKKASPAKPAAKKSSKPAPAKGKATTAAKVSVAAKGKTSAGTSKKGQPLRFLPLDNRVLIEPQGKSDRTPGGLYIPNMSDDKPSQGVIIAVGGGARNKKGAIRPLDVKLGDMVIYGQYAGTNIELEGRTVLILREEEILGVVKD